MKADKASSIALELHRTYAPLYNKITEAIKQAANQGLFVINIDYPGRVIIEMLDDDGYDIGELNTYNQITISW